MDENMETAAKILPHVNIEIVKRSDRAKGFELLPKRWVAGRTTGWLNRCRRLAKDWENLNRNALAFLRLSAPALRPIDSERVFDESRSTHSY